MKQNAFPVLIDYGRTRAFRWGLTTLAAVIAALAPATGARAQSTSTANGAVNGLTPKFIDAGGVRTRYYEMGSGQPLVLIHGGGGPSPNSANIWSLNIRPLAKHFLVIAPDRLGCGMTGGTFDDALNYPKQVVWLYNFLNALHLKRVNLVGHSAGGGTAFSFAVAHPQMVRSLILVAAGTETPDIFSVKMKLQTEMQACPTKPLFASQKCRLSLLSVDPQRTFDSQWWAANHYMDNWRASHYKIPPASPLSRHLAGIDMARLVPYRKRAWARVRSGLLDGMPVLILYGKQDPLDWAANSPTAQLRGGLALFDIMGAKDPHVQMVILNDAAHFVYRDQPAEFDSDLTHFIDYWNQHPIH